MWYYVLRFYTTNGTPKSGTYRHETLNSALKQYYSFASADIDDETKTERLLMVITSDGTIVEKIRYYEE